MTLLENVRSPQTACAAVGAVERALARIRSRDAIVAILGLGYVGLPLALAFAENGFRVLGLDVDDERVALLNQGGSPIGDVSSESTAPFLAPASVLGTAANERTDAQGRGVGSLVFSNRMCLLAYADAAIICVPTPLGKTRDPDMTYVISATETVARFLHQDMLVVLESTTYPGTTEEIMLPRLRGAASTVYSGGDASSWSPIGVGEDFFLAFSPERIDPGRMDYTVRTTPKVVGGVTAACGEVAAALYGCAVDQIVQVSQPIAAEMVKLLENTFRMTNIGLVNELAMMCDRLGVDVWEVIDAAATKPYGFMPFYPGPGLGGHCIPVDPHYLEWKMRSIGYNARFIRLASEMNQSMPEYVFDKIAHALNDERKPIKGANVLLVGVAYKANVSDVRESPAIELIELLVARGAETSYHDSLVPSLLAAGTEMKSVDLDPETLAASDCVVVLTAHGDIDWNALAHHASLIVDTRNALAEIAPDHARVVKL